MRPSLPEAPERVDTDAPDVDAPTGDVLTIEAPTAEQAIAQVHERLGADAEIVAADRVLRGGLWGFFPKQVVQLTARPVTGEDAAPAPAATPAPTPPATPTEAPAEQGAAAASAGGDIASVLARLSAEQDDAEEGLGEALRRHLGVTIEGEPPTSPMPSPSPSPSVRSHDPVVEAAVSSTRGWSLPSVAADAPRVSPAPDHVPDAGSSIDEAVALAADHLPDAAPPVDEAPAPAPGPLAMDEVEWDGPSGGPWSGRGLLMLGLPRGAVDAVLAQAPADDAAWTYAVARVLAPLCRPLPAGESVLVGPRAQTLGRALGLPTVKLSGAPTGTAAFAVACTDGARARTWLAEHRRHRWTHVVVSGYDWRGLLFENPLAVSWVGDDMLGEAIRVAHDLGMVLGPGLRTDTEQGLVPPAPIELAMLLRDMLGGRR